MFCIAQLKVNPNLVHPNPIEVKFRGFGHGQATLNTFSKKQSPSRTKVKKFGIGSKYQEIKFDFMSST